MSGVLTPHHTADGRWWWDGTDWLPAFSADGRWWFNGAVWVTDQQRRRRVLLRRSGLMCFLVGVCSMPILGLLSMGDPEDGTVYAQPTWLLWASWVAITLTLLGAASLLGHYIARRRLGTRKARQTISPSR